MKSARCAVSEQDFNPEDMSELQGIFAQMIYDNENGFIVEFCVSRLAAKELVEAWQDACYGDPNGLAISMHEYAKIMTIFQQHLKDDPPSLFS